jgi:hypothetical protein
LFAENLAHYPPLLPVDLSGGTASACRTCALHNGTIWRWNRPLLGFEADGTPHLRIEHRVMPAGPSIPDTIANAALYYGLVRLVWRDAGRRDAGLRAVPSEFLRGGAGWPAGRGGVVERSAPASLRQLLLEELLPSARRGLRALEIDAADVTEYMDIVAARAESGRTGAEWQQRFLDRHGSDLTTLTLTYLDRQRSDRPVHAWAD